MTYLDQEWDTFDAWCLLRGIDADALTSRRLTALTFEHLAGGFDKGQREALLVDLERIGDGLLRPTDPVAPPIPDSAPPPGWRSDADNWTGIQAALGSMGTMKKAVNRG